MDYEGRLTAHLPMAPRLIMVKADGCVAIHADGGAYKPLNWMNAPNTLVEGDGVWTVTSPKGEQLIITMEEILLGLGPRAGDRPGPDQGRGRGPSPGAAGRSIATASGTGFKLVRREWPTDIGPVDLLCRDADGHAVAVEVKRRGEIDGVEQLTRYLERMDRDPSLRPVRGVFVAQVIKPQARVLAESRGIACVEVDYDELRGIERNELKLF